MNWMPREFFALFRSRRKRHEVRTDDEGGHAEFQRRRQLNGKLTRPPAGPVLMLDFDGVLHPAQSGSFIYLPLLETWLQRFPAVEVVISSNWKDSYTLEGLTALFPESVRHRVLGTTPDLPGESREDEILHLVHQYRIAAWVALDDRAQEFPKTKYSHLVETDYFNGLTAHHLEAVERLLSGQSRKHLQSQF